MKRKQAGFWSELGSALTGVAALITALVGAAWFFAGAEPAERKPAPTREVQVRQDTSPQQQTHVDELPLAAYESARCKRVESIAALGWTENSKTHFCQKKGWTGVTNFPGGTYRSAAGGFCFEGDEKACLAQVLQRLSG